MKRISIAAILCQSFALLASDEDPSPVAIPVVCSLFLEGSGCGPIQETDGFSSSNLDLPKTAEHIANYLKPFYLNKCLTLDDLAMLKIEVGKYFYQNGRPFVRVAIPEQDVSGGILRLTVKERKAGNICTQGNRYFRSSLLLNYSRTQPGEPTRHLPSGNELHSLYTNPFHEVNLR